MRVRPAEESGFSCRAAWSGRPVRFMSPRHGIHLNADALLLQAFLRVIYSARDASPFQDNFKGTTRRTPKCTSGNSSSRPVTAPDPVSHRCRSHQRPAAGPRRAARDDACFRRLHVLTAQLKIKQPQSPKTLTSSLIPFLPPKCAKHTILHRVVRDRPSARRARTQSELPHPVPAWQRFIAASLSSVPQLAVGAMPDAPTRLVKTLELTR